MSNTTLLVTMLGDPIGWPRPRFVRGRVIPATGKAKRYAAALERAARTAVSNWGGADRVREAFASQAIAVSINTTFATRHTGRHGQPHTHKPDADNIAKLMDALVRAGALGGDDCRVVDLAVTKTWAPTGHISFAISITGKARAPKPSLIQRPTWLK